MLKILIALSFVLGTHGYAKSKKGRNKTVIGTRPAVTITLRDNPPLGNETALLAVLDRDVDLIIESGGGYVSTFTEFGKSLVKLQKRGFKVNCYIKKAYSMGFYIMSMCDKRYFYRNATVMTHDPFFVTAGRYKVTTTDARELLKTAKRLHTQIQKTFKTIKYKQFVTKESFLTVPMLLHYVPTFVDGIVDNDRKVLCKSTVKCKKLSFEQSRQPNPLLELLRRFRVPGQDSGSIEMH